MASIGFLGFIVWSHGWLDILFILNYFYILFIKIYKFKFYYTWKFSDDFLRSMLKKILFFLKKKLSVSKLIRNFILRLIDDLQYLTSYIYIYMLRAWTNVSWISVLVIILVAETVVIFKKCVNIQYKNNRKNKVNSLKLIKFNYSYELKTNSYISHFSKKKLFLILNNKWVQDAYKKMQCVLNVFPNWASLHRNYLNKVLQKKFIYNIILINLQKRIWPFFDFKIKIWLKYLIAYMQLNVATEARSFIIKTVNLDIKKKMFQIIIKFIIDIFGGSNLYNLPKFKSCQSAVKALSHCLIKTLEKFIVSHIKIKEFFNAINYNWIKTNFSIPTGLKNVIDYWFIINLLDNDNSWFKKFEASQKDIIFFLIKNFTLNHFFKITFKGIKKTINNNNNILNLKFKLIKYADDFVIILNHLVNMQLIKRNIAKFLKGKTLKINQYKF